MARAALELVNPYQLALHAYYEKNPQDTMKFILECDGEFAKWGWLLWGIVLSGENKFDEAIEKYKKSAEIAPNFLNAHASWGEALMSKPIPDYDSAIEQYAKVIEIDNNLAGVHNNLGVALIHRYQEGNSDSVYDAAIENYKKATELNPKLADAYYNWGNALRKKKPIADYDGAIEKYEKATLLDPTIASAYNNWGYALTQKLNPDYDGAIEKFWKAMKVVPKDRYMQNIQEAIGKDEHPRDAAAHFAQIARDVPNDWIGHYISGALEIRAGDPGSGTAELRRADKLQPGNHFVRDALREVAK